MLLYNFTRRVAISPPFAAQPKVLAHKFRNLSSVNVHNNLHERVIKIMTNHEERTYEDAIKALNGLQSNAATIAKMQKESSKKMRTTSIPDMEKFLLRIGIKVAELDQLNVIHVSGTKGKGSVCAFCESILRRSGLKTGFYSSPHLVEVRERIRINGKPLSRDLFTKYFFEVYVRLTQTAADYNDGMPGYFRFLTLMAFHVYLEQKVDVAVLEVGIGGSFDCTNVVRTPTVCGITKLDIDHANILGRTIEKIAWHKAGIMKPGRPALTVPQHGEAEEILFRRAEEIKANLYTIPPLSDFPESFPEFSVKGEHQHINAAMALQLARIWFHEQKDYVIKEKTPNISKSQEWKTILFTSPYKEKSAKNLGTFPIPDVFLTGLKDAQWLGRCQVVERKHTTFFLDGAHTSDSMRACAQWFKTVSNKLPGQKTARVLCFFMTGDRDFSLIMSELKEIDFDFAIFCPTLLYAKSIDVTSDLTNFNISRDSRLKKCDELQQKWLQLIYNVAEEKPEHVAEQPGIDVCSAEDLHGSRSAVFPSISSAIRWIAMRREPDIESVDDVGPVYPLVMQESDHVQVLISGSLHLVGGVLKFLGPDTYKTE